MLTEELKTSDNRWSVIMSISNRKKKIAIGAGLGLGAAAAITLARRPGLRAHLGAKFNTMFSSGNEKALAKLNIKGDIPKQSIQHARRMINDLKRQGYSLKQIRKMNIGVVGSTGSGKSSLARAIEQELGVARMSLDDYVSYMPFKSGNVDVQKAIKSEGGLKGGTVVEQSQLLHSGDPSQFDVIMKIERPVKDIKKGLLERGHAAVTHDYVDLTKAQTTVNEAFGTIGGHKRKLGSGLEMVVNPKGGDQATRMRLDRARELGLDLDKFKGLSQRDQIQSLANKSIKSNQSFRAHISSGSLGQDITIGGGLALGGGATGAFMSKESSRHRINAIMAQIDQHNLEKNAFAGTAAVLAGGALVGGGVGALAGGEGNRLGGAITGALTGAGLAYGGKQLMGSAGKLVSGGATGGTRANVIANAGLKGTKVTDDVLMANKRIIRGPDGKPLTSSGLNELKVEAAKDPDALKYLQVNGLIGENAVKTTTLGQHVKHTDDIANALKSGNPEAAYDRAIKSGFMTEGEAANQLQYLNPARLEAYQAQQAANRQAVAMAGGGSAPAAQAPVQQATSAPVGLPNQSYVPQINRGRAPSSTVQPPPIPPQARQAKTVVATLPQQNPMLMQPSKPPKIQQTRQVTQDPTVMRQNPISPTGAKLSTQPKQVVQPKRAYNNSLADMQMPNYANSTR
jgi:hypothetical protein